MQHIQINSENELILHLALGRITFLKFQEKIILSKKLDSPRDLVLLSIEDISNIINRPLRSNVIWDSEENLRMAEIALRYCRSLGIHIILYNDDFYPEELRQIEDPPYLLFCRGNKEALLAEKKVSVVGTRRLTVAGKKGAQQFGYDGASDGATIVSGLANGADGYAHTGVINAYYDAVEKECDLQNVGKTIAVLPCAIDEITPYNHKRLAAQIIETGGCLISEYEPKMTMANWHFVARNRIIAALSPATVVVEAPAGSGALITVDFALEYGRDVMFHKASVEEEAKKLDEASAKKLELDFAQGKVSKYKVENTVSKYLEAGAPIINDYKDYCECFSENPGKRTQNYIQGELF